MDARVSAAGRSMVTLRDRYQRLAVEHVELPSYAAYLRGAAEGLDLGLASLAGAAGYGHRETFEAELARTERLADAIMARVELEPTPAPMGGWEPRS
jgi:hypothetical protein